jgi:hypothetical protein
VQAEAIQSAQDSVGAAGHNTGCIEIFDAQQPATAIVASVEIAPDGCQQ